ncbi:MAG: hypothetical protein AAFZ74_02150 [Pseudomonadota bacterium]
MRLPDSRDIQRVVPVASGRIVTDDSTIQIGSAVRGAGAAMADESERRANFQISKARTAFLKAQADQDKQFEEDRDYEDMDTRYEEGLRKSLGEIGKSIKNERARTLFTEQMEGQVLNGVERTRGRARGIERDVERENVNQSLNALNETALGADDPRIAIDEVGALLEGAVEAGYYSAQEAGVLDRAWRDKFAANKLATMPAEKRLEALDMPWAQELPTPLLDRLREGAERDSRATRAIDMSERFWSETGGDYNKALRQAAKIKDTEDRLAVEGRLTTMRTRQAQFEREQNQDNLRAGWDVLEQGGGLEDIDSAVWAALEPQDRIQMKSWISAQARATAAGASRVTELGAYNDVYSFLDDDDVSGALSYLNANYDKFSESDYKSLRSKISNGFEDAATIESSRSLSQSVSSAIDRAGLKGDDTKGELLLEYDRWQQQYQAENDGAEPSDQLRDETIERLAAKFKITKPGPFFNDRTRAAYEVEQIGTVPERHTRAVLNAFGSVDERTTISEEKLNNAYSMAMAYFRMRGVNDPSDESITAMIIAMQESEN